MQIADFAPARPPCSVAERDAANAVTSRLRASGLRPTTEHLRAPTSPSWVPLVRALVRVWAAAFLAAGLPLAAGILAAISTLAIAPGAAGLIRYVPLLGAVSQNVVALRKGSDRKARPLVVTAHLDTHPTAESPMRRAHAGLGAASGLVALIGAIVGRPGITGSRWLAALVAAEAAATLGWLARRELRTPNKQPDDNTSGLIAIMRTSELLAKSGPTHDVWLVATGAGTPGSFGISSFLRRHPEVRDAWVVDVDALGTGEVVASPIHARLPHPGTPPALSRTILAAARASGDPLTIRRVRLSHSDARAASRKRRPAIALTGGLRPPAGGSGPDPANAERIARVIDRLARLEF